MILMNKRFRILKRRRKSFSSYTGSAEKLTITIEIGTPPNTRPPHVEQRPDSVPTATQQGLWLSAKTLHLPHRRHLPVQISLEAKPNFVSIADDPS
jgi:hypothetical protein